ncbi:MAG: ketoacyl-ACP synthase III [Chitinispirillaceae bacterium]|nr:ketoacyl-ACP synthase III [Chitinispirillaceae bacterium]
MGDAITSAHIVSVGAYVPETVMTNHDFEAFLDTSNEWIVSRTGIKSRHIVGRDTTVPASVLGVEASRIALERAPCSPDQIDAVLCATFTPDSFFPSTACRMQAQLGCTRAFAFDVSAACAGFVYALTLARSLILSGQASKVLVVGAEVISKTLDWTDRSTSILFGDGAGAVVIEAGSKSDTGIGTSYLHSDGTLGDILTLPAWGEKRTMQMRGNEVFKHAVRMMVEASKNALDAAGCALDEIDYFIPHQANSRIIGAVADHLSIPLSKVVCNLERYGNTSSASIPLALDEIWLKGLISPGKNVLFTALGGGLTVGSVLVRF